MPVFQLIKQLAFPPADLADPDGLLAVGGDLSAPRLLLAYSMGIFPWFSDGDPILWWSPDPRCILEPSKVHVSGSLAKVLRQRRFTVTFNRAFAEVVEGCAEVRRGRGEGTWITEGMKEAYVELHRLGFAHSVESWEGDLLVGGVYGVAMGRCFFGESMFHRRTDASKVAFVTLARTLDARGFSLIDGQLPTPHLQSLGARSIRREEFLERLRRGGVVPSVRPAPADFPDAPQ